MTRLWRRARAGQSQPPNHLSMFLEVTDPRTAAADWSSFVSHRLSVVNQRPGDGGDRSVTKESQNRYSKTAKDWGWREFVTLTSLFDQDSGFLVADTVVFAAEVLILKETATVSAPARRRNHRPAGGAPLRAPLGGLAEGRTPSVGPVVLSRPPPPGLLGSGPCGALLHSVSCWGARGLCWDRTRPGLALAGDPLMVYARFFWGGGCVAKRTRRRAADADIRPGQGLQSPCPPPLRAR